MLSSEFFWLIWAKTNFKNGQHDLSERSLKTACFHFLTIGKVFFACFGPKRYRFGIEQKLGVVVVGNEFFPNKFAQTTKKQETNGHGTILINKACQIPWVLVERKNTLRKLNLTFECRTDALLNKKQKKSNNSLLSAVRSWNVSF